MLSQSALTVSAAKGAESIGDGSPSGVWRGGPCPRVFEMPLLLRCLRQQLQVIFPSGKDAKAS